VKVMGIERDSTACCHYRIIQPLYKLKEHNLAEILTIQERDFGNIEYAMERIMPADVLVFPRPADEGWLNLIKSCRKAGKIIVCDYDDDPFNTSPLSPAYRFLGTEEMTMQWPDGTRDEVWEDGQYGFNIEDNIKHRDLFRLSFKKADLVTATTDILQESFKKINSNVAVLPNLVDFDMYPKCDFVKKEIRIGWQGGSSHYEDIYSIINPLREILSKHDNVKFVYAGDMRFGGLLNKLPKDKLEIHHWVPFQVYPYKVVTLNLDIGLCPLVDNVFNRNKSACKWMEYSTIGAATIASDIPPYSPVIRNNETGLLVKDNWVEAIEELIVNKEKRIKLVKNAYDDVYENHNADKKAYLWHDAYEKAIKAEIKV